MFINDKIALDELLESIITPVSNVAYYMPFQGHFDELQILVLKTLFNSCHETFIHTSVH